MCSICLPYFFCCISEIERMCCFCHIFSRPAQTFNPDLSDKGMGVDDDLLLLVVKYIYAC